MNYSQDLHWQNAIQGGDTGRGSTPCTSLPYSTNITQRRSSWRDRLSTCFRSERKIPRTNLPSLVILARSVRYFHSFGTEGTQNEPSLRLSKAFIACLKRFFGRGKSSKMFSGNRKAFVGANIELKKLHDLVKAPDETLVSYFNDEHIDWNFIPPRSPNFGGSWESGVKSCKTHLKRVARNSSLTLEECITVLAEIEAVLNSRPLSPLSSDFGDFETLSPGDFLIGRPVAAILEPQLINAKENRLTRWQRVNWLSQQILKVWKRNYLNNLQERRKWRFSKNNVEIDTLVLIKNESLPGTKWLTDRILLKPRKYSLIIWSLTSLSSFNINFESS
ncbi:integrase catalytic domain-containing protein [Trichonephila clavipes]|nr:integrase catalytic domain-containing protein [Trichonephila clavipes]